MGIRKTLRVAPLLVAAAIMVSPITSRAEGAKIKIGLSIPSLQWDYFLMVRDGVMQQAKMLGLSESDVIVADAQADSAKQISQVQDMITQGVTVVLYTVAGQASSAVPVRLARQNNIPVVCIDSKPEGEDCDTYISTDNVKAARILGQEIIKATGGKAIIGVLQGSLGTTTELRRDQGLKEAFATAPGMKVVAEAPTEWTQDVGFRVAQDMLQSHPDINVFVGRSDGPALGAAQAVRVDGSEHKIWIFGYDGLPIALQAIKDGKMDLTITQQAVNIGHQAVKSGVALLNKEVVPAEQLMKAFVTTKDNADAFIQQHP